MKKAISSFRTLFGRNKLDMKNKFWFRDAVSMPEHVARISRVLDIKTYLLGSHKVLHRPDIKHKEEDFQTAKILYNLIKRILYSHASFSTGDPISLNARNAETVALFNRVYKRGGYDRINFELNLDLLTYGNAFEFPFMIAEDKNRIKSHVIANEDAFPIYDDDYRYVSFVEHWKNVLNNDEHYIVYYPDHIDTFKNSTLLDSRENITESLPIHYRGIDKSEYNHFGEPSLFLDLRCVMDDIEELESRLYDGVTIHSLKPLGVLSGKRVDSRIPKDMIGAILNLEEADEKFEFATAMMDHNSIKLLRDDLWQVFYAIACIPATSMGQMNIANVSETSLRLLYAKTQEKASEVLHALVEGMNKRHECIRTLLDVSNQTISDEDFESLGIEFNFQRPIDTSSLLTDMKTQREMGALSIKTIVEKSPFTLDTAVEMQRLKEEAAASAGRADNATEKRTEGNEEGEENENKIRTESGK